MPIVINGSGTVTGVTNVGSAAANTAVTMNDSGSNSNTLRAWVNFNGTGTVAIRASFNVSSITDNGTGNYTVNFTTAMPDANYACDVTTDISSGGANLVASTNDFTTPRTTSAVKVLTFRPATVVVDDSPIVSVAIFR